MMRRIFVLLGCLFAVTLASGPAHASAYCQQAETALGPLPASLVPAVVQTFGLRNASATWVQRSTVVRCMGGQLWACNIGANLPCGKANTATTLPAGDDWCKQNPNSDFIPAYITGHDSARQWRCAKGVPAITGPAQQVDRDGYLSNYWKILE